ncbi:MAG: tetrathionate reductase family octaheme c-type cytochrome [Deltaproteobacteria bacterium]|nr:tetrathionate reductase family octaheme c-type cytochrome [Deltaproteobacteria bacterium]
MAAVAMATPAGDNGEATKMPPAELQFGRVHSENHTADHSKFPELQGEFTSGPEVTRACLQCHTEAAKQLQETIHWTWLCPAAEPEAHLGKAGWVVNNFCINIASNEPRCTSCHAGYGWRDKNFDFTQQDHVDCLVCHEQTGTYKKFPTMAGNVVSEPKQFGGKTWMPPDWNKVAQSVGLPTRRNCGTCHFFGGGGEGVKHGDLDASLFKPDEQLDVHMAVAGENFSCTRCHETEKHRIAGRCYKSTPLTDRRSLVDFDQIKRITCYACHTETPHEDGHKANDHVDKVACQTCHIPAFAREHSTKMRWDWSTAGRKDESGKPFSRAKNGRPAYHTKKGDFVWASNVQPEYFWFNGQLTYTTLVDKIDPSSPVLMNKPHGDYNDPHARIYPFKVHRGKQPYDAGNNTFVVPHLYPSGKDDPTAYWKHYEWGPAIQTAMDYLGLPYSGKMGFVETEYLFQTTHMVAPKEKALACTECHVRGDGRLANLAGFYMPGRDRSGILDFLGWAGVIAAFIGVLIHGAVRFATRRR